MRHFVLRGVVFLLLALLVAVQPVGAAEQVVEGESLLAGARAQGGDVSLQSMAPFGRGWSGGAQLFWAAQGPQSVLRLNVPSPADGVYEIAAFFTQAPDYGIVAVDLNGANLATFDGFAERVVRSSRVTLGRARLAQGPNAMLLRIQGRNPRSRGHLVGLDCLVIAPAADVRVTPPRIVPLPVTPPRVRPPTPRTPQTVPCALFQAPRPVEKERREVLRSLAVLEHDVLARPGARGLRQAFPFTELRTLASLPARQATADTRRRFHDLLVGLDALSLDPTHGPAMRDATTVRLHEQLRDLVDLSPPEQVGPSLPAANDLAAYELYGTIENWKSVKWVLRLHVVACQDDDGLHPSTVTKAQIQQGVAFANQVFEPARLRFVFDPAKDWEVLKSSKINTWDVAEHDKNAAAYALQAALQATIVVYSAWGPDPAKANGWAANGGTHIWIPSGGCDAAGLCHELGHYLGQLRHTFPGDGNQLIYGDDLDLVTAANVDGVIAGFIYDPNRNHSGVTTEQAMDGDGFSDTPPDPGNDYWEKKFGKGTSCDPAHPSATVPDPKGGAPWVFTPDRSNLLSYFFRCPALPTLTPQQVAAILGRLEGTAPQSDNRDLKRLIAGQTPWASSSGEFVIVGKVRNVGLGTSTGGRTAVLESVAEGQTSGTPLAPAVPVGPLAPGDWILVKATPPGGLSWTGRACLRISPGDDRPANDVLCPAPYHAPVVK